MRGGKVEASLALSRDIREGNAWRRERTVHCFHGCELSQCGDNESWVGTAWPLVHVVGDKRFAAFLETLDLKKQREIFDTIFHSSNGYFEHKFPRVAAIWRLQ